MDEKVLVVPRDRLIARVKTLPQGFDACDPLPYMEEIERSGRFVERDLAEEDPELKQIIPYCAFTFEAQIFLMRRRRGGGERRLHDKLSVGVGGHINPVDARGESSRPITDAHAVLRRALEREIHEELVVDTTGISERCLGILNDDSNPVGQVHLGVVFSIELRSPTIGVRESESLSGELRPISEIGDSLSQCETWSRLLVESLWASELQTSQE